MTDKEQKQWRDSMVEVLYPSFKERFQKELDEEVAKLVAHYVGIWFDVRLSVKQAAQILGKKPTAIYKRNGRGSLKFDKTGKRTYTISLRSMNIQLSGQKDPALELSGAKSSKVESGDSAGEAISEQ